jgi:hypothetical protein
MAEEENKKNMQSCPRFKWCSLPKCPLDPELENRTELPGDNQCPMMTFVGKKRSRRMKTRIISTLGVCLQR